MPAAGRSRWDLWIDHANARTIRAAMWGALLIWIGVMGIVDEPPGASCSS
jgi:hypothetical protein